jgi:hypothetical protein
VGAVEEQSPVKLAEFNALCDREWAKPKRGDVVSLLLTGPSAAELCADVLSGVPGFGFLPDDPDAAVGPVGAIVREMINPITRTAVKVRVKKGGVRETARVSVMGGTFRQTWWPAST